MRPYIPGSHLLERNGRPNVNTRRHFLAHAPLGLVGALAACSDRAGASAAQPASSPAGAPPSGASGPTPTPLLATLPADAPTLTWTPKHEELVYTFGGATPRQRIKPGTRIVTWTEDCFDGTVKTAADLPSSG